MKILKNIQLKSLGETKEIGGCVTVQFLELEASKEAEMQILVFKYK